MTRGFGRARRSRRMRVVLGALALVLLGGATAPGAALAGGAGPATAVTVLHSSGLRGDAATADLRSVTARGDAISVRTAAAKGLKIVRAHVRAHGCADAASLGSALGNLWGDTFGSGTSWSDDPRFLAVVTRPTKALTRRCGGGFAEEVVQSMNVFDVTWRTLTTIIDCTSGALSGQLCRFLSRRSL